MIEKLAIGNFEGKELPEGHLTDEDQILLKKYVLNKKLVVDLGTFKGRGAIIESFFAEKVVTIDNFLKSKPNKYEKVKMELSKYKNIRLIRGDSSESSKFFKNNSIDLIVQDAGHSADDVINDITAYLLKLKKDAIVMIHDYKYMNGKYEDRDVQGAVRILIEKNILKEIEIAGWYWIGQKI